MTKHTNKIYPETLNLSGALRIASTIEKYWHSLGYTKVRCRVEPEFHYYTVRSNINGGMPPK